MLTAGRAGFLAGTSLTVLGLACVCAMSCAVTGPTICTLIACTDSLRVTLSSPAPTPYRATLSFPGGQVVGFDCTSTGAENRTGEGIHALTCNAGGFELMCDRNPSYCSTSPVSVEVALADGRKGSGLLMPQYSFFQPNGPRCEPTCAAGVAALP